MIVVTGTKRSGTSLWMQILVGAGFPYIGEAFPGRWRENIGAANPEGFYESRLRGGVFGANAIDPQTQNPIHPKTFEHHAVKVFVRGLLRTEPSHLHRVIATVRDYREYDASRRRMWSMEDQARRTKDPAFAPPPRMEPLFEWWTCNYALLVDSMRRGYPTRLVAYDTVLEDPERTISKVLGWIGRGDQKGALGAIKPEHRTQRAHRQAPGVEEELLQILDELYEVVRRERRLTHALVIKLETVNRTLLPRIKEEVARIARERAARAMSRQIDDAATSHDDPDDTVPEASSREPS